MERHALTERGRRNHHQQENLPHRSNLKLDHNREWQ
jgi:hypothetical protein